MLSDYERTQELVASATNASGAADEQYGKTLDSLETKLNKLKNAWDQFTMGIANNAAIKFGVDLLTSLIGIINTLTEKLGSVGGAISKLLLTFVGLKTAKVLFSSLIGSIAGFGKLAGVGFVKSMKVGMSAEFSGYAKTITGLFAAIKAPTVIPAIDTSEITKTLGSSALFNSALKVQNWEGVSEAVAKVGETCNLTATQSEALSYALSQGVSVETAAKAASEGITAAQIEETIATQSVTGATTEETVAEMANNAERKRSHANLLTEISLTFKKIAAKGIEKTATVLSTAATGLETKGKLASAAASVIKTIATKMETSATLKNVVAIGLSIVAMAALVGTILLIVAAYKQIKANSPESQFEAASEAAEEASKNVENLTSEYNNLNDSITSLEDAQTTLDDLTVGTKEWKKAVLELNQQILDLIEKYPEFAKFVKNDNGVLTIDFDSSDIDNIVDDYANRVIKAQAAAASAGIVEEEKRDKLTYSEIDNDAKVKKTEFVQKGQKGTWRTSTSQEDTEEVAKLIAEGQIRSVEALKAYAEENNLVIENADAAFETLKEFGEQLLSSESKDEAQYQSMLSAAENAAKNAGADTNQTKGFVTTDMMRDVYEDVSAEIYQGDETTEAYAKEVLGLQAGEYEIKDGELTYTNDDGEEKTVSAKTAAAAMKGVRATEEMANRMEAFSEKISSFGDKVSDTAENLFKSEEGGSLTKADVNALQGKTDEELKEYLQSEEGGGWTDEEVEATYGSWEDFIANVQNTIEIATDSFSDAEARLATMGSTIKEHWSQMDLNADGLNAVVDGLSQIQKVSGDDAMETASDLMVELNSQLVEAGLSSQEISDAFASIDWTDKDSILNFSDTLEALGVDFKKEGIEIDTFEGQMISLTRATKKVDLTTLVEDVKSLGAILSDLKSGENTGSFSEGQYETLTSKGVADATDFVYNLETGNYEYTQGIDTIVAAIEQQTSDLLGGGDYENKIASGEVARDMLNTKWVGEDGKVKSIGDEGFDTDATAMYSYLNAYLKNMEAKGADAGFTQNYIDSLKALGAQGVEGLSALIDEITANYTNLAANKEALETTQAEARQIAMQNENPATLSGQISDAAKEEALSVGQGKNAKEGDTLDTENYGISSDYANALLAQAAAAGVSTEALEAYKTAVNDASLSNDQAAARALQAQIANVKLNDGLKEITDSYDDWTGLIDKDSGLLVGKTSDEISAINSLKKSMNKMLNTTEDLSDEFWNNKENIAAMKKAAEGDTEAIEQLQKAASEDYVLNLDNTSLLGAEQQVKDFYDWVDGIDIPEMELGVDVSKVWSGAEEFKSKFNEMVTAANMSASEIQAAAQSMGFSAEIEYVHEKRMVPGEKTTYDTVYDDFGYPKERTSHTVATEPTLLDGWFPVVKTFTASGAGGGGVSTSTIETGKSNKSGKSGSSSSEKETEWENPYDKQYNTLEDINAELKKRERLEKRYQILCARGKDTQAMTRNYYKDLVASLEKEYDYQDKIANAKKKEIKSYLKQNKSLQKYATFNFKDLTVEIDWKAIQKVDKANNEELGEKIEDFVSKLEEYRDTMEDAKDAQYDILQTLEDTKQELIDAYLDFEDRVASALQQIDQNMVDEQEKLYDAMNDAASNLVDSIRENIDATRQLRDNEDTEEELAKKERRLAYLRLDTSGANALEIKQLEEELEDEKLSYQDSLVDQALDKLQDQNDKAAEQRSRQIELMNSQIEWNEKNAVYTQNVRDLLDKAMNGDGKLDMEDELYKVLYNGENWNSYSAEKQAEMLKTANQEAINARQGLQVIDETHATTDSKLNNENPTRNGNIVTTSGGTKSGTGTKTNTGTKANTNKSSSKKTVTTTIKKGVAAAIVYGTDFGGWGKGDTRKSRLNAKFTNGWDIIQGYIESEYPNYTNLKAFKKSHTISDYYYKKYKTGGLADYTGPAWLDGTKSRPEMVLNATDTQNFIQLKDILRDAVNGGLGSQSTSGDYTFDIDINVEELANDYDVSQLAAQVRQELVSAMTYRNVNTIGIMR